MVGLPLARRHPFRKACTNIIFAVLVDIQTRILECKTVCAKDHCVMNRPTKRRDRKFELSVIWFFWPQMTVSGANRKGMQSAATSGKIKSECRSLRRGEPRNCEMEKWVQVAASGPNAERCVVAIFEIMKCFVKKWTLTDVDEQKVPVVFENYNTKKPQKM